MEAVTAPTGDAVLGLIPRLLAAVDGSGRALLPLAPGEAPAAIEIPDAAGPTAVAVRTSGSTGAAKTVLLPAAAIRHSAIAGQRRLHDGDPGTWLLTLPAHHIAGLNVLFRATVAGREPVVLDTGVPFRTEAFRKATARLPGGPAFVSLVPTQLHRLMAEPAGVEALHRFTAVLVGGAATPPELIDRARAAGVVIVTSYGMSETCGGCVYDGRPLDGVAASVDEGSRIVLSGPVVATGYLGQSGPPFGRDAGSGDRSFTTGDLGSITDDRLTVLGRADDILISGGVNVAPLAVEHLLAAAVGIDQIAITGVPDREWGQLVVAVVVPAAGAEPDLVTLRTLVTTTLGVAAAPKRLLVVDALPTRGPGKVDRAAVAALALAAITSGRMR